MVNHLVNHLVKCVQRALCVWSPCVWCIYSNAGLTKPRLKKDARHCMDTVFTIDRNLAMRLDISLPVDRRDINFIHKEISTDAWVCWLLMSVGAAVVGCWDDRSNVNIDGLCGLSVIAANSCPLTVLVLVPLPDTVGCFRARRPVCWSATSSYTHTHI